MISGFLRQSTASQEGKLGPFLDSTDGNTQETGLTIANTDIKLTKGGSTTEVNKNSGGATHVAGGRYSVIYDATDTNTLGILEVDCHPTGALPSHRSYMVLPADVYDAIVAGTDELDVNVVQWLGTAVATPTVAGVPEVDMTHMEGGTQTVTDLKDFADAGYDPATNKVQGVVLVDTTTTNTDMRGTDSAFLAASAPSNFGDLAITASTGRVTVGTNNDKTGYSVSGTITTLDGLNNLSAADVNSEVDTALADIHLDHLLAIEYDPASKPGTGTALLNELIESDSGVSRFTANALEQGPTGSGGDATAANQTTIIDHLTDIKGATWDSTNSLEAIHDDVAALNNLSDSEVLTQVNAALDTAISELGVGAPTATPSLRTGLMLLYMMARNRVDVDTTGTDAMKIYNDAGTQIASKAITDDGTDYSEAKMS